MIDKKVFTPIVLTQDEQIALSEACHYARDVYCTKARWECHTCKRKEECDILTDLELRLVGK